MKNNKTSILILTLVVFLKAMGFCQDADSLLNLLVSDKEDTNKVIHLYKLCNKYRLIGEYDKAIVFGNKAILLAQQIGFKKGLANSYNNMGIVYDGKGNFSEALKNHFAALELRKELGDKKFISVSFNNIGNIYAGQGNYPEAIKMYFGALRTRESMRDSLGIGNSFNNIGIVYHLQGNEREALKMHFASLKIKEKSGEKEGIANSYSNLGNVFSTLGNTSEALKYFSAALKIQEELGNVTGVADTYNNIGILYFDLGNSDSKSGNKVMAAENYSKALKNHLASLKIKEEIKDVEGIANSYINLGDLFIYFNNKKEARFYLDKALKLSLEIGSKDAIKDSYEGLVALDSATGNYKSAYEHHKLFIIYRDSIDNEETKKKTIQSAMAYEFEKKEMAAKAEQEKLNAITEEEKQKQNVIIYAVAGVLGLVIVFSLFLFNRFRITQRQKRIIEEQKVLVDTAYEHLHEKNKEVMDSIFYARRIQTALLPNEKYILKVFSRLMKQS